MPDMKRVRKRKRNMKLLKGFSLDRENRLMKFTGRNIFCPGVFFFEGDYLPMYEEAYLSLPFQEQNGEKGKMREKNPCISEEQERQKSASAISMKQGNRDKLRSSYSVEFTPVSGMFGKGGRGPHPLPF
jgi:hypothetical protein